MKIKDKVNRGKPLSNISNTIHNEHVFSNNIK